MPKSENAWVVWRPGGVPTACRAVEIVGFDDEHLLSHAQALLDRWPKDVRYVLEGELPRGRGPSAKPCKPEEVVVPDAVRTRRSAMLLNERLAEHVKARVASGIELLPIALQRAKGKKWPPDASLRGPFFVVNPIGPVDCIDEAKSGAKRDKHSPEEIERFRRLVIDPARVGAEVSIFRPKHYRREILLRRELADSMAAFTGVAFVELDDLES